MSKILYTAITGGYDNIIEPTIPKGWTLKVFKQGDPTLDSQRQARKIKILPWLYFEFEECIWFDGNLRFSDDIYRHKEDFALLSHGRKCIYEEAIACKRQHKAPVELIEKQIDAYRAEGMPNDLGMVATGLMYRKNTDKNKKFCEAWWQEIKKYTARDQLSFNYVVWKQNLIYQTLPFSIVKLLPHNK